MFLASTTKDEVIDEFGISSRNMFDKWISIYRSEVLEGLVGKAKARPKQGFDQN